MSRIKIGQIGVGHAHALGKMASYRASSQFEVVGVVEPNPVLRKQAEGKGVYKDLKWMSRQQLLNEPGLKAVAIETRVGDLLETAKQCVSAGMHIHLDKPAGESLPKFKQILDEAARKHLLVQMGYMYRYNPAVVMMRDFLRRGWLGQPYEVHTVMSKVVRSSTRKELAKYPGGIMFELGCHIIDLTVGVLGAPEKVISYNQHASKINDKLVDNMLAVFTYPRALASVKSSAMEVKGFARRHFVVCGDEGTFHIQPLDAPSVRISLSRNQGKYPKGIQEKHFGSYQRYVGDADDMAKIIRGEKDSDFPYDHDLAVQRSVLQASGLSTK